MVDPTNVFAMDDIKFMTGFNIERVVASESSIIEGIDKAYGTSKDATRKSERVDFADGRKAFDVTTLPDGTVKGRAGPNSPTGEKKFEVGPDHEGEVQPCPSLSGARICRHN